MVLLAQQDEDRIGALLREATARKEADKLSEAVAFLKEAKALMLESPVAYGAEVWCRLPLYLQRAGHYDEAVAEFQFLERDLPRRARQYSRLDDPLCGPVCGKQRYHDLILRNDLEIIEKKRALAEKRAGAAAIR